MSGGIEEAARYEEQCMKKSLETGKATGRLEELKPEAPGGYAPLINVKSELRRSIPEQAIDTALRETGLDKFISNAHPLQKVFDEVIEQVSKGKGEERHGNGREFMQQPWKDLCDTYGVGFAFGQAAKKLSESQGMTGEARKRELLGAIAYLAIGVLYEDIKK